MSPRTSKMKYSLVLLVTLIAAGMLVSGLSTHAAAQEKHGGIVTMAWPNNPANLWAANTVTVSDYSLIRQLTEPFLEFDEKFNLVPRLAESWSWEDNTTLVLKLRRGVKFTDGAPWDAEAAKLNLDFIKDGRFKMTERLRYIKLVEAVDKYTLRIKLHKPFEPFLMTVLGHDSTMMVSPKQIKTMSPDKIGFNPIGTGPFILKEWIEGDRIVMERNKDYWEPGLPYIDKLIYKIVPDRSVRTMMLLGGQADIIFGVSPLDAQNLKAAKGVDVVSKAGVAYIYIGLIQTKDIFKDKRVGKALNYAINRKEMVDNLLKGYATIADSTIPPGVFGYSSVYAYPYDPEKAKKLLAEAGYPNGFDMVLAVPRGRYLMDYEIGQYIQGALAKIGVRVKLITWEWGTYIAEVSQGPKDREEDGFLLNCVSPGHANFCMSIMFNSSNWSPKGSNRFFYSDPEIDTILDKAAAEINRDAAAQLYKRLSEKLILEDCPWIFLHVENVISAKRTTLNGMIILPTEQYIFRKAWKD